VLFGARPEHSGDVVTPEQIAQLSAREQAIFCEGVVAGMAKAPPAPIKDTGWGCGVWLAILLALAALSQ